MTTVRELIDRLRIYDPDMPVMVKAWGYKPGVQPVDSTETWGVINVTEDQYMLAIPGEEDPDFDVIVIN